MPKLKVTVGIPSATEYLHRKFVESLLNLRYPVDTDVQFSCIYGYQLPFARNRIVEDVLTYNSDYLLFLDSDMVFPPDLLIRLLSHDVDIVNALAFRRIPPHYPCIFNWNEEEGCYETMAYYEGLLEVNATGMAACLIKTEVFKVLKKPWFYYRDHLFSSDLTFCENVRKAGFKVWVDTDLKISHLGSEKIIDENYYLNHLSLDAKKEWNKGMREFLRKEKAHEKELFKKNESSS